ncbi:MAG: tRNA (uridine(34)/cytosine(34)/5-carboxymethylaminomethyluridine(34)-2'-O)-methyltransferase TrmL [Epulopiscium sp.]|nr:tRNA (uridine(34)/cytosine(34)/5-carboxymethylaminomethyluridine(34)-2'-O)-methyltransferase TrmL [Candidatus Epulonipiscium sp.]
MTVNIVLLEPEIPQNTGNIARTCAAIGASLHLIKPLGFSIEDKYLKRAGLDYWSLLDIHYHDSFEDFKLKYPDGLYFMATTKAKHKYTDVKYTKDCFIIFGKETAGIPETILKDYSDTSIRIPMISEARSLNLSNSVAIVAYEAMRQMDFNGLLAEGKLREYDY